LAAIYGRLRAYRGRFVKESLNVRERGRDRTPVILRRRTRQSETAGCDLFAAIIDALATAQRLRLAQVRDRGREGLGYEHTRWRRRGAWLSLFFVDTDRPPGHGANPVGVRGYFRCETWVSAADAWQSIIETDDAPGERLGARWLRPQLAP
jgi:hypothetical protein